MAYHVTHRSGEMEADFPAERFYELLEELDRSDREHPDVSLTHESEWTLTVLPSGMVVLENLEAGEPVHKGPLDRAQCLALLFALAEGRVDEVQRGAWRSGYPEG
jgi:hypothetical protein